MPTTTGSSATWTSLTVELPARTTYAATHGLPSRMGRLILEGDITDRELMAPVVVALTPRDGELLLAIVINPFGDHMERERVLGPVIVEGGLNEIRAVSDVILALAEASTVPAEEVVFIRAHPVDTEVIANVVVNRETRLMKLENRTYRGAVASILSPEFAAVFISSSHASVEILGTDKAIWRILQSVPETALPS